MTTPATSTITSSIVAAVASCTGLATGKVIQANLGKPRPGLPYASVLVGTGAAYGQDNACEIDASGIQSFEGDRLLAASVNLFATSGAAANDLARDLVNKITSETVRLQLWGVGLAARRPGKPVDLTGILEALPEGRVQVDLEFGFTDEYTGEVGLIEHLEIEATLDGAASGDIVRTITVAHDVEPPHP